jgi:hypothetical protein
MQDLIAVAVLHPGFALGTIVVLSFATFVTVQLIRARLKL